MDNIHARPRLHDQLVPIQVPFEYDYDNSTVEYVKQRGHNVTWTNPRLPDWSEAEAIRVLQNGTFEAAGDQTVGLWWLCDIMSGFPYLKFFSLFAFLTMKKRKT